MNVNTFLILWFLAGFITVFGIWITDMRNKDYDENYFNTNAVYGSLIVIFFGFISAAVALSTLFYVSVKDKKYFTRFIYKIANIGVKK